MLTVGNFNVAKLIENHNGIAHAKVIGTAFQVPLQAPQFAPAPAPAPTAPPPQAPKSALAPVQPEKKSGKRPKKPK